MVVFAPFFGLSFLAGLSALAGCVVPLPGIAAAGALVLTRKRAFQLALVVWGLDQFIGFGFRGYPHTFDTVLWGFALGVATVVAVGVASVVAQSETSAWRFPFAFAAAFVAYEATLMLASLRLGGWEAYSIAIVAQLALFNALWFGGALIAGSRFMQARLAARR